MTVVIEAKISEVVVFRDGARITRSGKVDLKKGEQTVIVKGISRHAVPDSFRVRGKGSAVLRTIDIEKESKKFEPKDELKELRSRLEELQDESEKLNHIIEIQRRKIKQLKGMSEKFAAEFGKWYAIGESEIKRLIEFDDAISRLLKKAKDTIRTTEKRLEDVRHEIENITRNITRIEGDIRVVRTHSVKIMVEVLKEGTVQFDITYQVRRANWKPVYDIDIEQGHTTLKRIAMINNSSAEDWIDVALKVSTATSVPVQIIEPDPMYISIIEGPVGFGGVSGEHVPVRGLYQSVDDMEIDESEVLTSKELISGVVVYEIPGRVTIPFDDEPHPITLTSEEFESKPIYYWNAYTMNEVVLQNEITNGPSVLIPGKARVYDSGSFMGESTIGLISPREKFRLGTRLAYDVKVKRELNLKDTDQSGITRGKVKREYEYALEIENFAQDSIEVLIVDRIPYSQSEKIAVELKDSSVEPEEFELGILKWRVEINSQEKKIIQYKYSVEWEKEVEITPPLP